MADAIISVVAERVAAVIEDQIRYEVNLVRGVEKEVLDLSDKLKTIRNVLGDAEKRGVNDRSVKSWLKKLEATAYEMDDILDEWNYSLLEYRMKDSAEQKVCCSFIPSSSCLRFKKVVVSRDTAKKIETVKSTVDQILKEKDDFNFLMSAPATYHVPESRRAQSTSSIEFEKVLGSDIHRNKNDIVNKLMLNGDSRTLCIVGMGGLGKTTLAQLVYSDTQVEGGFTRIWICVSDPFVVAEVARGIVESLTKEIIPPYINQLEMVLEKLRDCISGKKFLLVLDDVWTEDYSKWEPLRINLKYGAPGSKILVTTRNERVAKMMGTVDDDIYRPQQLNDEECWSLLRCVSLSGRSEKECGEFEEVGKKIASKCKGLPLAANVLGSLLQFKYSLKEWENVWKSEIWELEKAEVELFPHLVLSYNELSPVLRRCFSYCAVYSKDSQINAKSLIEQWMALGYLGSVGGNGGSELKGREYLNSLAMLSLFHDVERTCEHIVRCKMHDIVHDFALFLRKNDEAAEMRKRSCQVCDPIIVSRVQEYRSLCLDSTTPNLCDCLTSLKVLVCKRGLHLPSLLGMEKLIHLRWLSLSGTLFLNEDLKVICRLYFLQTLLLAQCYLKEIPTEIGNLVHLRHLDLSVNRELKELPKSMYSLVELQTLTLAFCCLEEIRGEIGNLIQLRNLDLSRNKFLKELPESICSLVELQTLIIEGCSQLNGLPEGIHRLVNLQHLFLGYISAGHHLPQGLGQLSGLYTLELREFQVGSVYNKLGLLKKLNRLSGQLNLVIHLRRSSDLEELAEDAGEAELTNKIHIQTLYITFEDEMDEKDQSSSSSPSSLSSLWVDVIDALEPYHKLRDFGIRGYGGSRLARWMSSPLHLIKQISLTDLSEVRSLPPMGKLPWLEALHVEQLKELKVVGHEFLGIETISGDALVVSFPKLKKLTFCACINWREWEDITEEEEQSPAISFMPCLVELTIDSCEELQRSYGDDKDGSTLRFISQNNPNLQLLL
ncbi:putative disease resistance protein RGA4 [Salvia divinorum]|uniref:Disease resistance protein RGA4 n=1 Tax=Salvia divinorum TaxID=28513 RepID=A0ABD1G2F3_SALDI